MAVSGTTAFDLDIVGIIEEAYEQAEVDARTGFDMRSARRSLDLLFIEWGNRGYNLWTVTERAQPVTAGVSSYVLGLDVIDLLEHGILDSSGQYMALRRVPLSIHANRNNKTQAGRPAQIFIDRQRAAPIINIWPVPDRDYTLSYFVLRRVNDTGNFVNTIDAPSRFLPALVTGLAHLLAIKKNPGKASLLETRANKLWNDATAEDREKADYQIYPEIRR